MLEKMTTILMTGFVMMIVGVLLFAYLLPYIIIVAMIGIPAYIIINKYKQVRKRKSMNIKQYAAYLRREDDW